MLYMLYMLYVIANLISVIKTAVDRFQVLSLFCISQFFVSKIICLIFVYILVNTIRVKAL
jgi:hypothetical protein